ncbi:MAG TPA: hypothetical protein VH143_24150, partial [Kofleriaceae bacterium]|nr:hypothetical protein [Kofleriaceae bacterium]
MESTKATVIAAIEAQRNELQVRSEGALLGERRAAIGRLVMIAIFAIVATTRGGKHNTWQTVAGFGFSLYAVSVVIGVYRIKRAEPRRSRWAPIILTLLDFAGTGVLGGLDIWFTGTFYSGDHAVSSAILMAFSVARISVWHVAFSLACAEASFVTLAI